MPFEAQSRSHRACCLRFAGRVTPPPRKTRYRRVVTFAGQDFLLIGVAIQELAKLGRWTAK